MTIAVEKDDTKIVLHYTIVLNLVPGMSWQSIAAQLERDNPVT